METLDLEPQISADRRAVMFALVHRSGPVDCVISRAALEAYFWLTPNADDARMLKTFHEGSNRIHAIAHRKLLAHPASRLELTAADFSKG